MPTVSNVIANPGFEDGDTGWIKGSGVVIAVHADAQSGQWAAGVDADSTGDIDTTVANENIVPVAEGQSITATGYIKGGGKSGNVGAVRINWLDSGQAFLSFTQGNISTYNAPNIWEQSTITASAPASTAYAQFAFAISARKHGGVTVDSASWSYSDDQNATLVNPPDGSTYATGDEVPLSVDISGTTPAPTQVVYKEGSTVLATVTSSDWSYHIDSLTAGSHIIYAEITLANGRVITTDTHTITISPTPPPPVTREFKASNAYTYLISQNFQGLGSSIPSVARIVGVELILEYKIIMLIRSKDLTIDDPMGSNSNVAFDIAPSANIEVSMMESSSGTYTIDGSPMSKQVDIERVNFTIDETMLSEGKKWTVLEQADASVTIGSNDSFFGLAPLDFSDFITRSFAFRFLPNLQPKPSYADSGDCCIRFLINQLKLRVYFDAGSAEYYFASPDKSQVLKGLLVAANVSIGDFRTGDAFGELQLEPLLTIKDGTQTYIGDDWTIHADYPPTDANQIGLVDIREENDGVGMSYNGLPSAEQITDTRSRYEMLTTNFYAVADLNSIYGVNGADRAFAYNGTDFYKIWTQPTASKDMPRHVANNQGHLALGFDDGRVDLSVVGQPYNYSGVDGASEWAIGDPITGLLSLPGTVLGVFGAKSIWGISGTTVDNFATQVIAPNIGAIEYTVTDMGAPVYANSFGIYTLAQTQQYGDFLGSPMSQNISPWIRPRMIRKITSDKEVVCAWPVRTKNQYRLAFSDGYILSMTMNVNATLNISTSPVGQEATSFSFQKYFTDPVLNRDLELPLYSYPAIVPIAISSQLDVTGEERIHIADKIRPDWSFPGSEHPTPWPLFVYETEKGWSFDGNYIPHFVEVNWLFGQDPTMYKNIQKIRIYGLTKGLVNLQVSSQGFQPFYDGTYSTAQEINMIRKDQFVTSDFFPVSKYADGANRGIGIKFKFEGSGTDIALPEPCHVVQAVVLQTTAPGTGAKVN